VHGSNAKHFIVVEGKYITFNQLNSANMMRCKARFLVRKKAVFVGLLF